MYVKHLWFFFFFFHQVITKSYTIQRFDALRWNVIKFRNYESGLWIARIATECWRELVKRVANFEINFLNLLP